MVGFRVPTEEWSIASPTFWLVYADFIGLILFGSDGIGGEGSRTMPVLRDMKMPRSGSIQAPRSREGVGGGDVGGVLQCRAEVWKIHEAHRLRPQLTAGSNRPLGTFSFQLTLRS